MRTRIEKQNKYFRLIAFINNNGLTSLRDATIFMCEEEQYSSKEVHSFLQNLSQLILQTTSHAALNPHTFQNSGCRSDFRVY